MEARLLDACAVLLGPHVKLHGSSYLDGLEVGAVRRAYRVLAVASHPDAARRTGARPGAADGRRFIEASHAYELLMKYLLNKPPAAASPRARGTERKSGQEKRAAGEKKAAADKKATAEKKAAGEKRATGEKRAAGEKKAGSGARHASAGEKRATAEKKAGGEKRAAGTGRTAELFYRGQIPRRRLRLAEYLYYSGRVSWQSLINAIVWQRMAKPKFGELARELREISGQDLARILASKLRDEPTGEAALRLRLLTPREVQRILILQRARHRPIGRYFVEKGGMAASDLSLIIREMHKHNARYGR
jgi:hypothetical protein